MVWRALAALGNTAADENAVVVSNVERAFLRDVGSSNMLRQVETSLTMLIDGAKPFTTVQKKASVLIIEIFMVSGFDFSNTRCTYRRMFEDSVDGLDR